MNAAVEDLVRQAKTAANAGRFDDAARLWDRVVAAEPGNADGLFGLGVEALRCNDAPRAKDALAKAAAAAPKRPLVHMSLAAAHRRLGEGEGELKALDAALAADPLYLPALLAKGACLMRLGRRRQAAYAYNNALKIAPPDETLPPELRAQLGEARAVVAANADAANAFVRERIAAERATFAGEKLDRIDQCVDVMTGKRQVYVQQPVMMTFPGLPAIQFYDPADFPWTADLVAATDIIRTELEALLRDDWGFDPYIAYPPTMPANQFAELNYSKRWSAFHFWRNGERRDAECARCPQTAAVIDALPLARWPGHAPNVMFSALSPKTHIPAHTGETNARLVAHLPLIVPDDCRFRVGNETREWREGEMFVFDDTIEHEAWNDSDRLRVVLILDLWNPFLSEAERALTIASLAALSAYYTEPV